MNKVDIRDAIVAHLQTLLDRWEAENRPMYVEMDNQDIDLEGVGDQFMVFDIAWTGTKQKNVAENPDVRYYGDIFVILFGKIGSGTRDRMLLEVEISEHFKFKALAGVQTREPTPGVAPGRPGNIEGWHAITVKFPFFADSDTN